MSQIAQFPLAIFAHKSLFHYVKILPDLSALPPRRLVRQFLRPDGGDAEIFWLVLLGVTYYFINR